MKFELRDRDRRALIVLVLAVGVYALVTILILPWYDQVATVADDAAAKEEQVARYRRAVLRKGRYEEQIPARRRQAEQIESVVIRAANPALAAAEMQSLIEEAARASELSIIQRSVMAPRRLDDFYTEQSIAVVLEGVPQQVVTFLSAVRTAPRFLTIRTLQIVPMQAPLEAPKAGEFRKTERVTLTLAALMPTPAASNPGTSR